MGLLRASGFKNKKKIGRRQISARPEEQLLAASRRVSSGKKIILKKALSPISLQKQLFFAQKALLCLF